MKKLFKTYHIALLSLMLCTFLSMTSCGGGAGSLEVGNAPVSVAGKTFKIYNKQGKHTWTVTFQSGNTTKSVSREFDNDAVAPTFAKYTKTGAHSATLQLGTSEDNFTNNWALIFASPNEGTVNTTGMTFTLF